MVIRNGAKTFAGNFMLVWKHLVYNVIVTAICCGLLLWAVEPIIQTLKDSGWIADLTKFFEVVYTNPGEIANSLNRLATRLYFIFLESFPTVWGSYALTLFVLLFLPNFLYNIGEYVLGVLTAGRMSSLLNLSYAQKLVSTLGRSVLYSLWKLLLSVPFFIIALALGLGYGVLVNNINGAWLLLPIFIGLFLFIVAIKFVFFIGFLPVATMESGRITASFAEGIDNYSGGFMKKVLYFWALFVVEFAGIVAIALFTIGTGLIIAIPSVIFFNVCCSFTNYFTTRKQNFYVGENTIVKPL